MSASLRLAQAIGAVLIGAAASTAGAAGECKQLADAKIADVRVLEAVDAAAPSGRDVRVAHCRVDGVIADEIKFSLLLPHAWNGKFLMGGGGGFVGSVQNQAIASVNAGYATVGTDTGHQGSGISGKWALNNPKAIENYGHLAVHRVSETAKALISAHYGQAAKRSYFIGCSNGGRQAMMEAQRYPQDFDGIVAGAPAMNFTGIGAQFIKDQQVLFPDPRQLKTPLLSPETLKFVEANVLAACDAKDGVSDGVMEDPTSCKFDLASLPACSVDAATPQCLTDVQRKALTIVYGETRNDAGLIFPGQPYGGEGEPAGWGGWVAGSNAPTLALQNAPNLRYAYGTEMFKYFVFSDPTWDYTRYEFKNWQKDTAHIAAVINATDPNLDAFKKRGGKLVMYHGWSDGGLSALGTTQYYEQAAARDPQLREYARLFMMPGVLHCVGGPGPDVVDWAGVIDDWVEKGKAPERVLASKLAGDKVVRTRPLCPYPQRAVYNGSGSTDDAANFSCK